mgnify:FL=1
MQDVTLRFYVLTSRNFKCLKRHFVSLPKQQTTVIINTLDKEYEKLVQDWCFREKINCVVTESNGKPGKGKNAVLDHFLDSDYDYMVQIDGDDFLQPHGVNLYTWVAHNDAPDGIQIVYSYAWNGGLEDLGYAPFPWDDEFIEYMQQRIEKYPETKAHLEYMYQNKARYEALYTTHTQQNAKWNYPRDSIHYMDCARLIFYSRKLAGAVRFREDLLIGEDSLLNYQVRDMAWKGQIKLNKVKDKVEQTYWYDLTNSGIVKRSQKEADWEWLEALNSAVEEESKNWTVSEGFLLEQITHDIQVAQHIDLGELNE